MEVWEGEHLVTLLGDAGAEEVVTAAMVTRGISCKVDEVHPKQAGALRVTVDPSTPMVVDMMDPLETEIMDLR
jgi:hypothetical protein